MNSKNRKITKNNKERNKNNKISCQQCFYNKKIERAENINVKNLNYIPKHSLCERFINK